MPGIYPYCVAGMAHVYQMVHTIPPHAHHAFVPSLNQSLYRGAEEIGLSVDRRRQLASLLYLMQIAYQPGVS
jgi:hypothetical protein